MNRIEMLLLLVGLVLMTLGTLNIINLHVVSDDSLAECAKQHNVYACEYVAVPKKGE